MGDSDADSIESLVTNWAENRAQLLFSNSVTRRQLAEEVQACDAALIHSVTALVPIVHGSSVLNHAWRTAKQAYAAAIEQSHDHHAVAGATTREAIQRELNAIWQQVGMCRGRPRVDTQIEALLKQYQSRRPEYEEALTAQLRSVSHDEPIRVRARVERTLGRICEQAAERGEDRYMVAVQSAQALYSGLPGKSSQSDHVFRTLCELCPAERLDVLEVFQADYGAPFEETIRSAYDSKFVMLKSFLRIPALQSALEDEYGIGAGLWKTHDHKVRALNWKARLVRLRQAGQVLAIAVGQLIPRSLRGWHEYRHQLSAFFHRLAEKANGPELARILAALQDDHTEMAVNSLFLGIWRGEAQVGVQEKSLLQRLSREQLQEVERRFAAKYGSVLGNDNLRTIVSKVLPNNEAQHLHALLDGDMHGANAAQFHLMLKGPRHRRLELLQWLAQLASPSVHGLIQSYRRTQNTLVDRAFLGQYFDGPMLDWAFYLVCNETRLAAAARLECALRRVSGEWPGTMFYDQPEERDLAVIQAHEKLYQTSFWDHFRRMGGVERAQIMQTLVTEGSLGTADQIRHCMIGIGADTSAIKATLSKLSSRQNAKLPKRYATQFSRIDLNPKVVLRALQKTAGHVASQRVCRGAGQMFVTHLRATRDLDRDLDAKLCGYNRFDVRLLRAGKTSNPAALYARLMQRVAFEQAGAPYRDRRQRARSLSTRLLTRLAESRVGPATKVVSLLQRQHPIRTLKDRDVDVAVKFYESDLRDQPAGEQQRRRFEMMVRVANQRLDAFREMKNRKAERQANIGAVLTSTGAFIGLVWMNLPYLPLACTVAASSLAGRYLVKTRIKGNGYGEREMARDAFMALIDGPTLALGQFVKTLRLLQAFGLGRTLLGSAVKMTMTQTVRRWGRARITDALLKSKESVHARRHLVSRQDAIMAKYGRILQQERERVLAGKRKSQRKFRGIERVFVEIGKQVAARTDPG